MWEYTALLKYGKTGHEMLFIDNFFFGGGWLVDMINIPEITVFWRSKLLSGILAIKAGDSKRMTIKKSRESSYIIDTNHMNIIGRYWSLKLGETTGYLNLHVSKSSIISWNPGISFGKDTMSMNFEFCVFQCEGGKSLNHTSPNVFGPSWDKAKWKSAKWFGRSAYPSGFFSLSQGFPGMVDQRTQWAIPSLKLTACTWK